MTNNHTPGVVGHRFGPNVADHNDGYAFDMATGEFRAAIAAWALGVHDDDALAMTFALERLQAIVGPRGVSGSQLLDALGRVTLSVEAGGCDQVRRELQAAAAMTEQIRAAHTGQVAGVDDTDVDGDEE